MRDHDMTALTGRELERARRELEASLAARSWPGRGGGRNRDDGPLYRF